MENIEVDGYQTVRWTQDPKAFLEANLTNIVSRYAGILQLCGWDPQKVGKGTESYNKALDAYKMAIAGI